MRKTGCRVICRYYLTIKINFHRKLKILFDVYSARAIGQYFFGVALFRCNSGTANHQKSRCNHLFAIVRHAKLHRNHVFVGFDRYVFSCQWRFVSKFAKTRRFAAICNRICAKFAIFRQKYKTSDKTVTKSTCNVVI